MVIVKGAFNAPRERLPALALAMLVTVLVFAAINAGFTPHAADVSGRTQLEAIEA